MSKSRQRAVVVCAVLFAAGAASIVTDARSVDLSLSHGAVAEDGAIRLPEVDFRRDWTMLGVWTVDGGEEEGAAGLHVVYTQPEAVDAYRSTGRFPDGAVLVKELLSAETDAMTTGIVSRAHDTEGWFVMVKAAENPFPGNPLWGDGWGWAYFDAAAPDATVTGDYRAECLDCHIPAEDNDWVYIEGYPVLRGAR